MSPKTVSFLILLLALGLTGCQDAYSGILILNGAHSFSAGEILIGEMALVSGEVVLEKGSRLTGSVYMMGGHLLVDGEVGGDLSMVGGEASLGPGARVEGGVNQAGGRLSREPGSEVFGPIRHASDLSLDAEAIFPKRSLENRLAWVLPQALMVAVLALVPARYFPRSLGRVSRAMIEHPVVTGALGLLSGIVIPALLVLMAFTVILLPVTILGLLAMGLVLVYGWMAGGSALGSWLNRRFNRKMSHTTAVFWGTFVFMLAVQALTFIPWAGPTLAMMVGLIAIGAVLLTRFGTQTFVPSLDPELPEVEI